MIRNQPFFFACAILSAFAFASSHSMAQEIILNSPVDEGEILSFSTSFDASWGYPGRQKFLWDDTQMQTKLDLSKAQRRDLIELKIRFEEAKGPIDEKLKEVRKKMRTAYRDPEAMKTIQIDQKKLQDELNEVKKELFSESMGVLLPHQAKNFRLTGLSKEIQRMGVFNTLLSGTHGKSLVKDSKQKKKIEELRNEFNAKLSEMVEEALEDANKKILKELDRDERGELDSALEGFEYKEFTRNSNWIVQQLLTQVLKKKTEESEDNKKKKRK